MSWPAEGSEIAAKRQESGYDSKGETQNDWQILLFSGFDTAWKFRSAVGSDDLECAALN